MHWKWSNVPIPEAHKEVLLRRNSAFNPWICLA